MFDGQMGYVLTGDFCFLSRCVASSIKVCAVDLAACELLPPCVRVLHREKRGSLCVTALRAAGSPMH